MPKSRVIEFFEQRRQEELALAEIQAGIGDIAERTLRRWLAQLVDEKYLQRSGARRGTRYRLAQAPAPATPRPTSSRSKVTRRTEIFGAANIERLDKIRAPLYTRPPVTYAEKWLASYVPNRSFYLSAAQRRQLQVGKRPGILERAGTYIQKILDRLLVDLSYNSARLEGNTYTVADTERLVLQGISAEGKLDAERIMILNHKEAIGYLAQNVSRLTLQDETVRTLHYLLADSLVAPGMAGRIRDESIRIGGTTYAPLEGRERLSKRLTSLLKTARQIEDPFEQSFFVLAHISYLQAFVDVNKRTARLASIIPLITNDYVPQSFIDVDKDDYLDATICLYELNEVGPLARLYCWSYLRACQHYDVSTQVISFDEIAARYRPLRRALVAKIVKQKIALATAPLYVRNHTPKEVARSHRSKFTQDVLTELEHLDVARMAGLGLTRKQLEAWMRRKG